MLEQQRVFNAQISWERLTWLVISLLGDELSQQGNKLLMEGKSLFLPPRSFRVNTCDIKFYTDAFFLTVWLHRPFVSTCTGTHCDYSYENM